MIRRRFGLVLALVAVALVTTGCFTFELTMKLRPDGSGTLVRRVILRTDWMKELQAAMGGESSGSVKMENAFTEEEARAEAAKFGKNVRFVSARSLNTEGSEGQEAIYAFDDVRELTLKDAPAAMPMPGMPESGGQDIDFDFSPAAKGTPARLTLRFPKPDAKVDASATNEPSAEPTKEDLEQAKKLLKGLRLALAVEIDGRIRKISGAEAEKNRVTFLEMDFEKLLSDEASLKKLQNAHVQDFEGAKALLKGVKGFRIPVDQTIEIQFQ